MLNDKRGFVYFVEIALSILILLFIFDGFLEANQNIFTNKQIENLRWQAWGTMDVLHELGVLDHNVETDEFGKIDVFIKGSLFNTQGYDMEFYNSTGCFPINAGVLGSAATNCDSINAPTENDVVSALYSIPNLNISTSSIRLYLWSKL